MKKLLILMLILALAGGAAWYFLRRDGYTMEALVNKGRTRELSVHCGKVHRMLLTSTVRVTVFNHSARAHKNVRVHITSYDKDREKIREKSIGFERDLPPGDSLSKVTTLPGRARDCRCILEDTDPE